MLFIFDASNELTSFDCTCNAGALTLAAILTDHSAKTKAKNDTEKV